MKTCLVCGRRWPWHQEDCGRIAARYPAELYDGTPPSEPVDTSQAAAESIKADANSLRQQVYDYLSGLSPLGSTDDAGEVALGMCHQTYSARRRELYLAGQDPRGRQGQNLERPVRQDLDHPLGTRLHRLTWGALPLVEESLAQ